MSHAEPQTETVCIPRNNPPAWYWAFRIDGKPQAEGEAQSYAEGIAAARHARQLSRLHDAITEDVRERFAYQDALDDQAAFMDHSDALEEITKQREAAKPEYQPKTGKPCGCNRGVQRDNCPNCEGTGQVIDFAAIRARR